MFGTSITLVYRCVARYINIHIIQNTYINTYTRMYILHKLTYAYIPTYTHKIANLPVLRACKETYVHTYLQTCVRTHAHAHAHEHTHTHTYTHTHTQIHLLDNVIVM